MDEAQKRVFNMGVFSTARVSLGRPDRDAARVPVTIQVRESPPRTIKLGGGAGLDAVHQEVHLTSEWSNRDFLGGLRRLTLRATPGWAFLPSIIGVATKTTDAKNGFIYKAEADFEQPRFLGHPQLQLKDNIQSERTVEPLYTALGGRTSHGVRWQPTASLSIYPSYNLQGYRLNGEVSMAARLSTAPLLLGCSTPSCFIVLSFLEQDLTWDRRDNPLEPRRGHYLSLSLQEGGGPLAGDYTFLRIAPEVRAFASFGQQRRITLATRFTMGTLISSGGDSSVVSRFFAGGANSMRGFSLRRLSPLALVRNTNLRGAPLYAYPIGGNGDIEGNVEMRFTVAENVRVAAFMDFGTVTRDSLSLSAFGTLQFAVGLGVRYLSPVGPIRLDIGVRLPFVPPPPLYDSQGREISYQRTYMTDPTDPTKMVDADPGLRPLEPRIAGVKEDGSHLYKGCFGLGGGNRNASWVTDGLCAFHLSIGEAF
jgi:translocation and assembly module TamA